MDLLFLCLKTTTQPRAATGSNQTSTSPLPILPILLFQPNLPQRSALP